jgi:hypothetical protein
MIIAIDILLKINNKVVKWTIQGKGLLLKRKIIIRKNLL